MYTSKERSRTVRNVLRGNCAKQKVWMKGQERSFSARNVPPPFLTFLEFCKAKKECFGALE